MNAGFADIGFVGSDKIDEAQLGGQWSNISSSVIAPAGCDLVWAAKESLCNVQDARIATSYPNMTERWLNTSGIRALASALKTSWRAANIVLRTTGATEGYFGVKGVNSIVDIRERGDTLKQNGWVDYWPITAINTKMIWCKGEPQPILDPDTVYMALAKISARRSLRSLQERTTTTELLENRNELVKKLGSEMGEFIADLVSENDDGIVGEAQDVLYALAVALTSRDKSLIEALNKL